MRSFWTLTTERQIGGQSFGPIPWSKVVEYARDELGLDPELVGLFWQIISAMDGAFLDWQGNEHSRYVRSQKPHVKKGAGGKVTSAKNYGR